MSPFSFRQLDDGRNIECVIFPSSQLSDQALFGAFKSSDFSNCRLHEEAALEAIATARTLAEERGIDTEPARTEAGDDAAEPEPLYRAVIAERIDAKASLKIAADRMMAELTILSAEGGKQYTVDQVRELLAADKVKQGIDEAAISDLLERATASAPGSQTAGLIARGRRPEPGVPSEFRCLVVPFQERILAPQQREDGTLDMRDLGEIDAVNAGDVLMKRIPAHAGEDGHDVLGQALPSEAPRELPFKPGKNTEVAPRNEHHLIASCAGVPHRRSQGMEIDDVLLVQDVDLNTGHIRYDGTIFVKGDIIAEMVVEATGDVVVNGFIESAEVRCGGDLIVKNSIIGRPPQGHEKLDDLSELNCRVSAQNITAHYAQHAVLDAAETIDMRSQMLYCLARCQRLEVGGERQRRAKLIGGIVKAREEVVVGVAGAEAATRTRIGLDLGLDDIESRLQQQGEQLTGLKFTLDGLKQSVERLHKMPKADVNQEKLQRARNTVEKMQQDVDAKQAEYTAIESELKARRERVRFVVYSRVYPGVELSFLDCHYVFKGEIGAGKLGLREDGWGVMD